MPASTKFPFRITLSGVLVLTTTVLNLVRLLTGISWSGVLESYAPRPGVLYIDITGAIWFLGGCVILWSIWRRKAWALNGLLAGAWLYAIWGWSDRIFLQAGGSPNWRFAAIWTLLILGFITAVCLDPRCRRLFGNEAHERELQAPTSS